jgi:coenzyme F420-reducing hydrogenase beta subunit
LLVNIGVVKKGLAFVRKLIFYRTFKLIIDRAQIISMQLFKEKVDCCGCHACRAICPKDCITMDVDHEGFLYPKVDKENCIDCGMCKIVCPMTLVIPQEVIPLAFASWNRDDTVRSESSSGGVFHALMQDTFKKRGIVFGAAFDEKMQLRHQSAECLDEAIKFRGSKYVQSIMGVIYQQVQNNLKMGRNVLFSGTPCQVAGLYSYLRKDYDNLLTCDVVCHGVPSPKVLAAYQAVLEKKWGGKTKRIAFRDKRSGWKRYSVSLLFDNNTEYHTVFSIDPFMRGFLQNTYLRPSCHQCKFSRFPRVADISMADFWGVERIHPEWDDDKGTSLILVQTEKGKVAFEACRDLLVIHEADIKPAIQSNSCICGSVQPGKNREAFFADLNGLAFNKVMSKYMAPPGLWQKILNRVRRVICFSLFL